MSKKPAKMTLMQKRAMENIASGKYKTLKDAMIDAGYSEETAKHPGTKLVEAKAVQSVMEPKYQALNSKLDETLSNALENCRRAVVEGDKDAESAWKSEFSAKLLKIFERYTEQLIRKESKAESEINHEELKDLTVDYLVNLPQDKRQMILQKVESQLLNAKL